MNKPQSKITKYVLIETIYLLCLNKTESFLSICHREHRNYDYKKDSHMQIQTKINIIIKYSKMF